MAYSQASNKATQRYIAKTYDKICFRVHKGQRQVIQDFAAKNGKSLTAYITDLIQQDMDRAGSLD